MLGISGPDILDILDILSLVRPGRTLIEAVTRKSGLIERTIGNDWKRLETIETIET